MEKQDLKQQQKKVIAPSETEEQAEEKKRLRRLQMMMNMVMQHHRTGQVPVDRRSISDDRGFEKGSPCDVSWQGARLLI